jgi:replicative DNA helicase
MNNTELNWFSCVRNNIDLIEDSVIFNLNNPFENEELNSLLFYYRDNIKNYKTLRNALKASFESLSVDYPKSELKTILRSVTALESNVKSYEEELIDKYKKRTVARLIDKHHGVEYSEQNADVIVEEFKNIIAMIDDTGISTDDITKQQAIELITEKWEKLFDNDFSDYIQTGIKSLDDIIIGFQKKTSNLICARPAVGKTALGLTFQNNFVEQGLKTGLISVEMTKEQLIERLAYINSEVPADTFTNGDDINPTDSAKVVESLTSIRDNDNYIIEATNNRTISNVARIARKMKRDNPDLQVIIVDYIQKIEAVKNKGVKTYEIEEISGVLTDLAKKLDVVMIPLAQLNRATEQNKEDLPQLSNLEGSSALEKDAHTVLMIHRSYKGAIEASSTGSTNIAVWGTQEEQTMDNLHSILLVAKNRSGKTGLAKTIYNARCTKFLNYDFTQSWNGGSNDPF